MCFKAPSQVRKPSLLGRYACAGVSTAIFSVWFQLTFQFNEPANTHKVHSYHIPLFLTTFYLISLPILKYITQTYLLPYYDVRAYLKETMVLYNVSQVALNGWMVYRLIDAVMYRGHPFIGDMHTVDTGAPFIIWVHYCDKYLEFFDTYFMVLRGRMDQVSFLHVYHHYSITWAWYWAINLFPGGDSYFGALLNSFIHVLMYSYYVLSLLKISCPWKRYLTQAQLLQFTTVVIYTIFALRMWINSGECKWNHITCAVIQVWEMMSLFLLFSFFYKRSYGKKSKAASTQKASSNIASTTDDDQCQKAVKAAVKGAANVVEATAKDMEKMTGRAMKATSKIVDRSI